MRELLVCSAIVVVALAVEYVRWLRGTGEYPVWRSVLWVAMGEGALLSWLGVGWIGVALLLLCLNAIVGLLVVVQVADYVVWWRCQREAQRAQRRQGELDNILMEFISLTPDPDYDTVMVWIARYPQFEKEITEFAIAANILETLPSVEVSTADTERLAAYGRTAFKQAMEARNI